MSEDFNQAMQAFSQGITEGVAAVSTAMQQVVEQVVSAFQGLYDAVWEQYRASGMPYGESHEGMIWWIEDLSKIKQAQQETEYAQQHEQMLIDARALGKQIRARSGEV